MKKKHLIIGVTVAALSVGGFETWQTIHRARANLVALNVTDAPLADVLSRIARQTREHIVAEPKLDGKITLHVDNAPLREVLGQIARQTDGFARLNFAVGRNDTSLDRLESQLRQGGETVPSGWMDFFAMEASENQLPSEGTSSFRESKGSPSKPAPDGAHEGGIVDIRISGGSKDFINGASHEPGVPRAAVTTIGADGKPYSFDLSPERLLIESNLVDKLGDPKDTRPLAQLAASLARRVNGKWRTIYTLEHSPIPPTDLPPELTQFGWRSDPSGDADGPPVDGENLEANFKRHRYDQLSKLTPEQRVREAVAMKKSGGRRLFNVDRH